jgi:hypothetical protein
MPFHKRSCSGWLSGPEIACPRFGGKTTIGVNSEPSVKYEFRWLYPNSDRCLGAVFFDVGYGVNRSIILGSRTRVSWSRLSIEDASVDATDLLVTPYIEVPMSQGPLTGFFVGSVGFAGQFAEALDRFGAKFAAGLGIRGFVGDTFSLEGSIQGKLDVGTLQTEDDDATLIAPGFLVLFGVSSWC